MNNHKYKNTLVVGIFNNNKDYIEFRLQDDFSIYNLLLSIHLNPEVTTFYNDFEDVWHFICMNYHTISFCTRQEIFLNVKIFYAMC